MGLELLADIPGGGATVVSVAILLAALAVMGGIAAIASRYKKIPPNEVGIFFGRKYKYKDTDGTTKTLGFRIVAGGGSVLWPIVEQLQTMSTAAQQCEIDERGIPNKDNIRINVKGVATFKISSLTEDIHNAAMAFLGKEPQEIMSIVKNIFQGHLRSIIGKMDMQQILRDRDVFNKQVVAESEEELKRLGIQIVTLVIQEVNDEFGYIEALGQPVVAEAKRDAAIKVAQADSSAKQEVSNAQRTAAVVQAQNAAKIAEAEKIRNVQIAQFQVEADTEKAKAQQALGIATAAQEQRLKVAQADRDAAEKTAQIAVQEQEALRMAQQLTATVIKPAEAAKSKAIIDADAARQATIIAAEADQKQAILRAEGARQAAELQGQGEGAQFLAIQKAKAEGEATVVRQKLIAEADGTKAKLLAEAEGNAAQKRELLLGEAKGTQAMNEALANMSPGSKLILIMDRLPLLSEKFGDAGAKIMAAIFESVAKPLGQIESVNIVDMGGNGTGLTKMGTVVPEVVFGLLSRAKAAGIDLVPMLKALKIDTSRFEDLLGGIDQPKPQE